MLDFWNAVVNPQAPFIRYALIAGILSSIPFGIIGTFVVVKRMSYIAGAISHTALGGIGFALWLNFVLGFSLLSPTSGALLIALLAGAIIAYALNKEKERLDTVIGIIWAVGMSLGLIFIYSTPGYMDPMSYLFGNILLLSAKDLYIIAFLSVLIVLVSVIFHNQFLAVFFDAEFAQTKGISAPFYQTLLILLIALTVILLINMVGIVMVIALLTIPAAIAGMFAYKMKTMMILAILASLLITSFGLFLSYILQLPTGSVTIVFAGILYLPAKFLSATLKIK